MKSSANTDSYPLILINSLNNFGKKTLIIFKYLTIADLPLRNQHKSSCSV